MLSLSLPKLLDNEVGAGRTYALMRVFNYRSILKLLTAAALLLSATSSLQARPIKFPSDEPTFTVTLPAGWTSKPDKDGNLDCDPGDDSGYSLSILQLEGVHNKAELKAILPTIVKKMAQGAKLKNLELGDVDTSINDNEVPFIGLRGDGKTQGIDFVVVIQGFEPQKGKFYAIMTASSKEVDDKHEKSYNAIYDSIKGLE